MISSARLLGNNQREVFNINDLVDTTEMYLRTVLELEEEGVPALRAALATHSLKAAA